MKNLSRGGDPNPELTDYERRHANLQMLVDCRKVIRENPNIIIDDVQVIYGFLNVFGRLASNEIEVYVTGWGLDGRLDDHQATLRNHLKSLYRYIDVAEGKVTIKTPLHYDIARTSQFPSQIYPAFLKALDESITMTAIILVTECDEYRDTILEDMLASRKRIYQEMNRTPLNTPRGLEHYERLIYEVGRYEAFRAEDYYEQLERKSIQDPEFVYYMDDRTFDYFEQNIKDAADYLQSTTQKYLFLGEAWDVF